MLLNLSPFQAYIVKNALRSYNTELLTSSDDWREFDNIFEQIADLSDTSRADDFYKQSSLNRNGKDLDSLWKLQLLYIPLYGLFGKFYNILKGWITQAR